MRKYALVQMMAVLAIFGSEALAAVPDISLTGKLDYTVEYDAKTNQWINGADTLDNTLMYDPACILQASVTTTGDPNIGTITLELWKNGLWSDPPMPTATLTGTIYGITLKLGQVSNAWEGITAGEGAGAAVSKSFGAVTLDAVTGMADYAAKVDLKLPGGGNVFGGFASDFHLQGLGFVGGNLPIGPLNLGGKLTTVIGDAGVGGPFEERPIGFIGTASVQATDSVKLSTTAVRADEGLEYSSRFLDVGGKRENPYDAEFESIGWATGQGWAGGTNIKFRTDLIAIPGVMKPYIEFKRYANDTSRTTIGTSFAPLSLTDIQYTVDNEDTTTLIADFNKTLGSAGTSIQAKTGTKTDGFTGETIDYTYVKLTKSFEWLNAWVSFGVHDFGQVSEAKIGANATFTF